LYFSDTTTQPFIMLNNTTIIIIRHAEKPASGPGLAVAGLERAQAYSIYLNNMVVGKRGLKFSHLFASEDSQNSDRPLLTITPFAKAIGKKINTKYKERHYADLAKHLQSEKKTKYAGTDLLICWHHGKALALAQALGVDPSKLPASANWPSKWHGDVFGWVLQLVFDKNGNIIPAQTRCYSEQLMYGDYGQQPPMNK
jgi:hypothetical protein